MGARAGLGSGCGSLRPRSIRSGHGPRTRAVVEIPDGADGRVSAGGGAGSDPIVRGRAGRAVPRAPLLGGAGCGPGPGAPSASPPPLGESFW